MRIEMHLERVILKIQERLTQFVDVKIFEKLEEEEK